MTNDVLPISEHEAENTITGLLDGGETLLWAGQPRQGLILRSSDLFVVPFSLMWGGFAIFWEYGVITSAKAPGFFMLWGIPFVVIGIYFMVGRFFADAWIRSRTYYGVTDRRVLLHRRLLKLQTTSFDRGNLPMISLDEYGNDRATIRLGNPTANGRAIEGMPWPGSQRYLAPSLEQIADGKRVFELLNSRR